MAKRATKAVKELELLVQLIEYSRIQYPTLEPVRQRVYDILAEWRNHIEREHEKPFVSHMWHRFSRDTKLNQISLELEKIKETLVEVTMITSTVTLEPQRENITTRNDN